MLLKSGLTLSEANADADGGEDETEGRDDDEKDAADAETHEDVVDVAAAVLVGSCTRVVLGQGGHRVPEMVPSQLALY